MRESGKNYTNWDRLRGTPKYNGDMLLILHGIANSAGLFETDGAVKDYHKLNTVEDFKAFCRKWDTEGKINLDTVVAEAEKAYEEAESMSYAPQGNIIDDEIDLILRKRGISEPLIAELREKRRKARKKPKLQ